MAGRPITNTLFPPSVILLSVKADEAIERGESRDLCVGILLLLTVPEDATYESDQQQAVWAHPRCICLLPTTCDGNRGGYQCLPAPYPWRGARRQPSAHAGFWMWRWRLYRRIARQPLLAS